MIQCYVGLVVFRSFDQSKASIQVMGSLSTNKRPVSKTRDLSRPIRGQDTHQLLFGLAPAGVLPQPEVPEPPPPLLEGGGPQPLVPLLRALVSPGRGYSIIAPDKVLFYLAEERRRGDRGRDVEAANRRV